MGWIPRAAALAAVLMVLPAAAAAAAVTVPPEFDQRVLASGLSQPTQAAWAPDGRIFIVQKPGQIRVVTAAGTLLSTPLMDIADRVDDLQDRGLLGIALSPTFATDHRLYYAYTYDLLPGTPDSDAPMVARVERVTVDNDNTVGPPTVVLGSAVSGPCPRVADDCMPSDGRSHSIGTLRFGPDGTLWVGLGDSASYAAVDDLAFRAQEEGVLSGKLLHVDTNGRGLPGHPFCPAETDLTKACTKIFAKGFRNPYRFTLDNGVPMVGDVGWGSREELDRVVAGGNYGWPCWEGDRQTTGYSSDPRCVALYAAGGVSAPLYTYSHNNANAAIIGGPVLPASSPWGSPFTGDVFFADYAKGTVQRLDLTSGGACTTSPCTVTDFASGWFGGTDLELSPAGNLAWTLFGTGGPDGSLVEVVRTTANHTPVAKAAATSLGALSYRLSAAGSTDPDGDPLTATWDFGDGTPTQTGTTVDHTYATGVTQAVVTLTVSDGRGGTASDTVTLTPGNAPPRPQITAPADGATYVDGQPVTLHGSATDTEDGALSGASLVWHFVLHHGTHVHVLSDVTGPDTTFTPDDDHDADSHYSVTLTATDSAGSSVTTPPVTIVPKTVALTLQSDPAGVAIGYADQSRTTPATFQTAAGFRTTLTAPVTTTSGGRPYRFASWSDGGAAQHTFVAPGDDTTLTATYEEDKAFGRPATASSTQNATYTPDLAIDGVATTRWSSAFSDNQWWQVDLGAARAVDSVRVMWEAAYATHYLVQTSTDGTTWATAADVTIAAAGLAVSSFSQRTARYVRITALTRATIYGASFFDVQVLGPADAVAPPPPGTDLARSGTASASSVQSATYTPDLAIDGVTTTRWSSARADNQWWQVDLGSAKTVGSVKLDWEAAYASHYVVETSVDAVTWAPAADVTIGAAGSVTSTFAARSARFVRVTALTRATTYGVSFWDAHVYAETDVTGPPPPPVVDLARAGTASASSVQNTSYTADKANDGDVTTRWSSGRADNQWWQVDLGATKTVGRVVIAWEAAYASVYDVQVSTDGTTFTTVASVTATAATTRTTTFTPVTARYVRIVGRTRATTYGISFFSAEVYSS